MAAPTSATGQSKPNMAGHVELGVDGKPKNKAFRANMFEEEVVLTEKQKLRKEMEENRNKFKERLKHMTPIDMFVLFDEDDSGLISFEEFRKMLPYLDVTISDAKAFRYFRLCDTDGSGEIDVDEFQVALFICDPTSGNPVGFRPSKQLTPMDAFELFDEGQTGFLEEDEFRYAVEYLKIDAAEERLENLWNAADHNNRKMIDYEEFRSIFIEICDARRELEDRGIDVPSLMRKSALRKMLLEVLLEEEDRERRALAEARRYKQWMLNVRGSKKILQKAEFRAYQELRAALDAAGQVYVLGSGSHNQFDAHPSQALQTQKFKFEHFDRVLELWKDRVQPQQLVDRLSLQRRQEEQEAKRDQERGVLANGLGGLGAAEDARRIVLDPFLEAQESPFRGLKVSLNTAALWGRRIHQVAVGENVVCALADTGEVFTWGGQSYWWHEIQPDSIYQTKWRGDTTARSQLLLGTQGKSLPPDKSLDSAAHDELSPEERAADIIKMVAKYFNVWEPPPNPAQRAVYLEKEILPRIEYDAVRFSLTCRGKRLPERTKLQLMELLYEDIRLEKRLLGERAHKAIREIELQVAGLQKRKKTKLATQFLRRIDEMWAPLREVQAEQQASQAAAQVTSAHEQVIQSEENYQEWRNRIRAAREDMSPSHTPRGNSLAIPLQGATPRANGLHTPRGFEAALQIAAGTAHMALVHKTGQLYTWGVGTSGRLGHDVSHGGDPQADVATPCCVQALRDRPVLRVSAGFSHTAAIVSGGELYVWGSTAYGKCGLGDIVQADECYCAVPTKVLVGPEDRRVRKVSCGAAHTAVVTEAGHLFVFGCGDGGRLGLGAHRLGHCYQPTLVEGLTHERVQSVSCGNTTTLVCTEITRVWVGDIDDKHRQLAGGRLYVAGSANVLGRQYDAFTRLRVVGDDVVAINDDAHPRPASGTAAVPEAVPDVVIKAVSAGYMHSAVLSADGELFCWGHNRTGCCGAPLAVHFVPRPTAVPFLYTRPQNLALRKKASQSSTYNRREAAVALDGHRDGAGLLQCTSTHQQAQPWLEVDLGHMAVIDKVVLWNRTDEPVDRNMPRDLYTARLFPCWVMVGRDPFPRSANILSLKESLRIAVAKAKFTENKRVSTWRCPAQAQGRYIRVQLERYNTLSLAQIEVYGYWGYSRGVGRCSFVHAARDVTVAVLRPVTDPRDVERAYSRAVYADARSADILRQYETYALEFDKFGRGDVFFPSSSSSSSSSSPACLLCRGVDRCETCTLYQTFAAPLRDMPPAIGGRRPPLTDVAHYLLHTHQPPLQPMHVPRMQRPEVWTLAHLWRDCRPRALWPALRHAAGRLAEVLLLRGKGGRGGRAVISPQAALGVDPAEMMTALQYMRQSAGPGPEKGVVEGREDAPQDGDEEEDGEEEEENSALLPPEESLEVTADGEVDAQSYDPSSSVGSVQRIAPYRHGFQKPDRPFQPGDVLPGGQRVRGAYPKSMAQQLDALRDRNEAQDRDRNRDSRREGDGRPPRARNKSAAARGAEGDGASTATPSLLSSRSMGRQA